MGRWAQRRRSGGGGGPSTSIILESASYGNADEEIVVQFTGNIEVGDFTGTEFTTGPNNHVSDSLFQDTPSSLIVVFIVDVTAETDITYSGSVPGIITPTTVPID
jgi:hypothetical protein